MLAVKWSTLARLTDVNVSAGDYAAGVIYRAMIDAALEEG